MFENRSLYIPYYNCLSYTKWIRFQRDSKPYDKQEFRTPININIIINSCVILEGFFFSLIKDQLFVAEHELSSDHRRIEKKKNSNLLTKMLYEYSQKLEEDSWTGYLRLFEMFTDTKIQRKNPEWEAIQTLFKFRNILVHGNELEFQFLDSGEITSANRKVKSIFEYCRKNDLADIDRDKREINILTNRGVDFFFEHMRMFAINVFEILPQARKTKSSVDMFEFREDYPSDLM